MNVVEIKNIRDYTHGQTKSSATMNLNFPSVSAPKSIYIDRLLKKSQKWDLGLVNTIDNLPSMWHNLQTRFEEFNIYIKK